MIRNPFTACLLLFTLIGSAQGLQALQQKLQQAKTHIERIYALDDIATYYTWSIGKNSLAEEYGSQQIALGQASKQQDAMALAYHLNGIRLIENADEESVAKGKEYFSRGLEIAEQNNLSFYKSCVYIGLSNLYINSIELDGDKALEIGIKAIQEAEAVSSDSLKVLSLVAIGNGHSLKKENATAYRRLVEALQKAELLKDPILLCYTNSAISKFYERLGNIEKALTYLLKAEQPLVKKKDKSFKDLYNLFWIRVGISKVYALLKNEQKSKEFITKYFNQAARYNMPDIFRFQPLYQDISIQIIMGNYAEAAHLFRNPEVKWFCTSVNFIHWYYSAKALAFQKNRQLDSATYYYQMALKNQDTARKLRVTNLYGNYATFLMEQGKLPLAIRYFEQARVKSEQTKDFSTLATCYYYLDSVYYELGFTDKAYQYRKLYHRFIDSLRQVSKEKEFALLEIEEEQKALEQERLAYRAKEAYKSRLRTYSFTGGLMVLLLTAAMLWRNNRVKQKANARLQEQKEEIEIQKAKVEGALDELKAAQTQLIQREKLASLGELTAGIAHEIQNPLNFVNNFSETNTELILELKQELNKGDILEASALVTNIEENEQKINHHGKRAENIVKNMLEHSRASKGGKHPTDINALVDEYLRLAYHGFRAKDKSFNAGIETHFDESIGKVEVVPQEIGRVLLNLFNNAFWAVNEKKKQFAEGYEPIVSVTSKEVNDIIEIKVNDNGTGIPQKVIDKVFQPFITTKPTGQGTGLGLSLSYDIVKAHGGELKVESTEGEGATFMIQLPLI